MLVLSARHEQSLRALAGAYANKLVGGVDATDLCHAAATRRSHLEHRVAITGDNVDVVCARLSAFAGGEALPVGVWAGLLHQNRPPHPVFLFSGQGSHWPSMGRWMFNRYRIFREVIEECDGHFAILARRSLIVELARDPADSRIDETDIAQPAIFAVQAGLSALWRSFGLKPGFVLGQSLGEVGAAYASGALSLKDALRVVWVRSRLMHRLDGSGRTAAIGLPLEKVRASFALASAGVVVAGTLSPNLTLVSGSTGGIDEYAERLRSSGIFVRSLQGVNVALHSPDMESLREEMLADLDSIVPRTAETPFVSSVTAGEIKGTDLDASYWYRNMRESFRFDAALEYILAQGCAEFLEISPHPMLASPVSELFAEKRSVSYFSSLRRNADEQECLFETLARLYVAGYRIDWQEVFGSRGPHADLPHYPWRRERYWFDQLLDDHKAAPIDPASSAAGQEPTLHPLLGRVIRLAVGRGQRVWEAQITPDSPKFLKDHRIQGTVVLPGAAYSEMASAAARELSRGAPGVRIRALKLSAAMVIDSARIVQTVVEPSDLGGSFRILSTTPGSSDWTLHAQGIFMLEETAEPPQRQNPPANLLDAAQNLPTEDHYAAMASHGVEYR